MKEQTKSIPFRLSDLEIINLIKSLSLPIKSYKVSTGKDYLNESAIWVHIILDSSNQNKSSITNQVRKLIGQTGDRRWVYAYYQTPEES